MKEQGNNSKTDEMVRKQSSNFKAFEHTLSNINLELVSEKWEFDHLLRTIQSRWSVIDSLHWELDSELGGRNSEYEAAFFAYESKYNNIIKSINRKLWSVSHREQSTPHLEIPAFGGSYHQWSSFKDLFVETIHNNPTLSSAQKMQFLKTKIRGEAGRLTQHLPITSDNYAICWDILNNRYNNKRLIFNSHLEILLNIPAANQPSINHIKRIHDTALETLNAIKNLGVKVESWDPLLVYLLCQKLDTESHNDYLSSVKQPRELPNMKEFLSFLESKFTMLESSRKKSDMPTKSFTQNNNQPRKYQNFNKFSFPTHGREMSQQSTSKVSNSTKYYKCAVCKSNEHALFYCQQFLNMTPYLKCSALAKLNICENCLYSHNNKACFSEKRCHECNAKHNTILHDAFTQARQLNKPAPSKPEPSQQPRGNSHVSQQRDTPEILLATAMIRIKKFDGTYVSMRALIDQGSQTSIITEHAAQLLGLPRQRCRGVISGVGAKENSCKGMISISCTSIHSDFEFDTDVYIMKNLIKNLPSHSFAKPSWSYLNNITLADPEFNKSRPVDLLLGADIYSLILLEGICRDNPSIPIAQNTRLGWILTGNVKSLQCNVIINNLEEIQKFWEIQDINDESIMSLEDQQCIEYYLSTTKRRDDGHYEVRLPMKPNFSEKLGESKSKAIAQFRSLERKFNKHPIMEQQYKSFIQEYRGMGHMIPASSHSKPEYYSTHHSIQDDTYNSKFRVVFNNSSKTSSGISLNDVMECGPNLQQDLQSLILKWRVYKIAFTGDIEKMFRQIWMNPEDQKLHKIVWRESLSESIKEYQLTTVTYGTKAAPFLAMMTLKQLASDERSNYSSQAIEALEKSFYMDDLVHGAHNIQSAKQLQIELIHLLKSGGFNLRKWKANTSELLQQPPTNQEEFNFKNTEQTKTLGLSWNPQEDTFSFQSAIDQKSSTEIITKRMLLSEISQLFDLLGWLTPLSTKLKLIFQQIWTCNLQWDEQIPSNIFAEWTKIRNDIHNINLLKLPRWIQTTEKETCVELHGFCDSSEKTFACVIYCRVKREENSSVVLLVGKSRLIPLSKKISLPRLELCGAHLLAKLIKKVKQCLCDYTVQTYGWTDSMVVLGWLNGNPARWKTFVANRVTDIIQTMPADCWHHVKSEQNPADCATRGLTASQLKEHSLWWQGPAWLQSFTNKEKQVQYSTDQEAKSIKQVNIITQQDNDNIILNLLALYSSFNKVLRVVAWILRIKNKTRSTLSNYLSLQELKQAKTLIIKNIQALSFHQEIADLRSGKGIHSKSKLWELCPYLDELEILRVGGRLRHANLDPDMQHPIIIPSNSRLSELLIDQAHELTFHGGARLTSAYLRKKYWVMGGKGATKKRLRFCVTCRRHSPSKHNQIMSDIPAARSNPSRSFYHTSVDFTGHLFIKASAGRGIKASKGYIAVFTCMVTKAVHLEIVSDLRSSSFLAALRRMSARRGTPGHIYSDNGTNFLGANNALQQEYEEILNTFGDDFHAEIADMGISWHFNAPSWPSANGLCEAAVKSVKYHLKRVLGDQKLTYEELSTLCAQVEAGLNSRPLCPLTEDPDDLNYLTPAHFLSCGPTLAIYDTEKDMRTRWYLTEKIYRDLWKRWQHEYLTTLSNRSKWRQPQTNISINDIVIIHDANLPPGKWALGRVVDLHPGSDGYVRVVTLKTKNGFLKRPIVKLSVLPINPDQESKQSSPTLKQSHDDSETKPTTKSKKFSLITTATTILLFFMTLITSTNCLYNSTPFQNNQSLFFDKISNMELIRDNWKLVVYYDLSPYWEGTAAAVKYIDYLESICSIINKQSPCDNVMSQLNHEYSEIRHYNIMLQTKQFSERTRRRRRGLINAVGNIANTLFGVLDSKFAEKYEEDIQLIKENQNYLGMLWKNQTSIVEAEFNIIKRTETIMSKHHKIIHKKITELDQSLAILKAAAQNSSYIMDFTLSAVLTNNILNSLKNMQDHILNTITDIYHGRLDLHLLSPEQLQRELNVISSQLPPDLSLPTDNVNILKMYKLLSVKTRLSMQYLLFEIRIPLISRDLYEVFHIIPIPQRSDNYMINILPISKYIAINIHKDATITLTEQELSHCLHQSPETILCYLSKPIYQLKNDHYLCRRDNNSICTSVMKPCNDNIITTNKPNIYFYFCCNTCHFKLLCNDQISPIQLQNAGLLTLGQDCLIKSADFSIYSHKQLTSEINVQSNVEISARMAPINHLLNISLSKPFINDTEEINGTQLSALQEQINQMKRNEPLLERVSYHDVHHYVAIYLVVGGAVVVGAAVGWRRVRRARNQRRDTNTTPASVENQSEVQCRQSNNRSDVQCQCGVASESVDIITDARTYKQNRGTSPVLQSVFTVAESRL